MRTVLLTAYEPEVQSDLFRLGHSNMLANVVSAVVLRTLMSIAVWNEVPPLHLGIWLGASVPSVCAALVLWWVFRAAASDSNPPNKRTLTTWMWGHAAVMGLLGLSSGMIGVLLGANTVLNLLIACAFVGSAAYSVAGNSTHDLLAFILTILLGGTAMSLFVPNGFGALAPYMIGATWLYMSVLCVAAYHSHKTVVNSIRLRLANQRLAEQSAAAAQVAEQASRDKSDFLAAASHDLRQPVHALLLFVEALRQQRLPASTHPDIAANSASQDQLVGQIAQAGQAISGMFNDLMELSRLESGADQALPSQFEITSLLQASLAGVQAQAHHKGLRLRLYIAPSARNLRVFADRVMLSRVVANLLANAVRYTPQGGVLLALRLRRPPGGLVGQTQLELSVWDTGIGIESAQQARIFEPYVQVGNAERDRNQGQGLGLAIVRQCLRRMGLGIQVVSRPGAGSCFKVRLPGWQHQQQSDATPARLGPNHVGPDRLASPHLAGRHLLLVDDDAMVRTAQASVLALWQMDVVLADSANQALALQHSQPGWRPDFVLCDYRLPGPQNGIDLLHELVEIYPESVGILQTGERPEQVQAQAEDAGFLVLYKPVLPADLAATLAAVLPQKALP